MHVKKVFMNITATCVTILDVHTCFICNMYVCK
jgi:hypothetical protein